MFMFKEALTLHDIRNAGAGTSDGTAMAKFEIHLYTISDLKGLQGEYLSWIFSYYRTKYSVTYIDGLGPDCSIPIR